MDDRGDTPAPVSFAVLALCVSGAGVVFLALTTLSVAFLPLPPLGRAVVALIGVVMTIAAMGVVSHRITARAIRAEYGDDPDAAPAPHPGQAPGPSEGDERGRPADGLG